VIGIEFERESHWQTRARTTEITCDVDLDHGCSIRLASDEPTGEREWRILEFSVDYTTFDVTTSAAFGGGMRRGPEPVLPECALLRAVRAAFAEWVAAEPVA
jgi:hypothetical protein